MNISRGVLAIEVKQKLAPVHELRVSDPLDPGEQVNVAVWGQQDPADFPVIAVNLDGVGKGFLGEAEDFFLVWKGAVLG